MAEDAQKRNTDCVYYLASPLTCKKGNACEFRHSESARLNPRDCWYWFAGNCLMTNCSFRHPPLDGRPNNFSATIPVSSASTASVTVSTKNRGPCYFFSSGYCAKGENCTFQHGSPVVQTLHQSPEMASANKSSEIHFKGSGSVAQSSLFPLVKGVSQKPPNVFIRAQNSSVVSTAKAPLYGDKKDQDESLLSRRSTHEAAENQQQELELINNQSKSVLLRIRSQEKFVQKKEHSDKNGLSKEGFPMDPDESNGSMYKEDWEYCKEDDEYHIHELGHLEVPEEFHDIDGDGSVFGTLRESDNSSRRGSIRTTRDLRDHLMQRRLQRKEHTSVEEENSEGMNHLDLSEIHNVRSETGEENHRRFYQYPKGKHNREAKRLRREIGLHYEGDTMPFGNLHGRNGRVKSKSKVGRTRSSNSEVGKKSLSSTFRGPKSLAEIRAEKDQGCDGGSKDEEYTDRRKDTYAVKGRICSVISM